MYICMCLHQANELWQNSWMKLAVFGMQYFCTASAVSSHSSKRDITGAKQSSLDHVCGFKLPNATILYLAWSGFPSLQYLIVEITIVGSNLPLPNCFSACYSSSLMVSHILMSTRPSYSALYDASHMCLSLLDKRKCLSRVGAVFFPNSFALTFLFIINEARALMLLEFFLL